MPADYPGITFDSKGVCGYCLGTQYFGVTRDKEIRERAARKDRLINDFENKIEQYRGRGEYDCIVPLSGGKDSSYLTYLLRKTYDLRVLAYTLENWLHSPTAKVNIRHVIAKLGVDHVFVTPKAEFFKRLYRYSLLFAEKKEVEEKGYLQTTCSACARLILGTGLKEAVRREIPFVMTGHGPDQITRYFYEMPNEDVARSWVPQWLESEQFPEEDKKYFWDPAVDARNTNLPQVISPLHVLEYGNPQKIATEVVELGLIEKKNASPRITNCHLAWLLKYVDMKRGYDPFVARISHRIRTGAVDRRKSLITLELINLLVKLGVYRHFIRRRDINLVENFLDIDVKDLI